MRPDSNHLTRRRVLKLAAAAGAFSALGGGFPSPLLASDQSLRSVEPRERKLLFILGAWGGASIVDSFMAVPEGEVGDLFLAPGLNVFPDAQLVKPARTNLRVPRLLEATASSPSPATPSSSSQRLMARTSPWLRTRSAASTTQWDSSAR